MGSLGISGVEPLAFSAPSDNFIYVLLQEITFSLCE
jgi:hypothetical protein